MDVSSPGRDAVLAQLERVLSSPLFRRAERSSALLRFIVEQSLDGQDDRLKEYTLGAEALGRGESFDPRTDPVVRAEAFRLRSRLEQYNKTLGRADPLVIVLPKGSYVPQCLPLTESKPSAPEPAEGAYRVHRVVPGGWVPWLLTIGALALAAVAWIRTRSSLPNPPFLQFDVELKSDGVLGSDVGNDVVLSPDGSRVVFVSRSPSGRTHLNARRLDQPTSIPLSGTDGARVPFFSPDGRWVAFWADRSLRKAPVDGGSPVVLCEAADLLGASWGEDDSIVMASEPLGKLWRVPAAGGVPQAVIDLTAESATPRWPQILPGGRFVLYTASAGAGADRATIEVQAMGGGERKVLVQGGTFGRYLTSGHLMYVNQGTLYAVPFDLDRLAVDGAPVPVVEDVSYSPVFGYAQVDVSQTGILVCRKGAESGLSVMAWVDRSGRTVPLAARPGRYCWPRLSPDGRHVAVTLTEGGVRSILVHDTQKGDTTRVTKKAGDYGGLTWWPTGDFLTFGGEGGIQFVRPDGSAGPRPLASVRTLQVPWSVPPDGQRLLYYERNPETGFDLWSVPIAADEDGLESGTAQPLLRTAAFEVYPSLSPDGRWMTYNSNESGAWEVYVGRFPDEGPKARISTSGGVVPRWSPNGRELLYRTDTQRVMVVSYKVERERFVGGSPWPWSPQALADTGVLPNFDVSPDGERLLALLPVALPAERQTVNHVTFMLNFGDELRRRTASR